MLVLEIDRVSASATSGWRLDPCRGVTLFVPKGRMAWICPSWKRLALAGAVEEQVRSRWRRRATNRIWKVRRGLVSEVSDLHTTHLFRKGQRERGG